VTDNIDNTYVSQDNRPEYVEVVSVVDGQVIRIPAYYHPETDTIDFETDEFGIFALVYYV